LTYKNWDLLVFGQGAWGNQMFQAYRRKDVGLRPNGVLGGANYQKEALNAWTTLNPNSNYPRLTDVDLNNNFNNPSDFFLQSAAYFRLKTLQIGYSFPKKWINRIGLERVRVYGSVSNLFTLTQYNGYDPELIGGVDKGVYPQAKNFIIGLNVGL
jgi:hypothetical protein